MRSGVTLSDVTNYPVIYSNPGSVIKSIREAVRDPDGDGIILKVTGKIDLHEMINSYAEQTDMSYILARLAAGDASVINVRPTMYGDFSEAPYDHRAALQTVMDARTYFDHLPAEKRLKFDNDFTKWFSSAGSPEWIQNMTNQPAPAETIVPEVETHES